MKKLSYAVLLSYCFFGTMSLFAEEEKPSIPAISRLAKEGNYEAALKIANRYLTQVPQDSRGYKIRGHIYFAQQKYPEALSDFTHVIEDTPGSANAYVDRAGVYYAMEDYDKALADIDQSLALKPNSAFALMLKNAIISKARPPKFPSFRTRGKGESLKK